MGKSYIQCGIYGPKQGHPSQNIQMSNQIKFVIFSHYSYCSGFKVSIKGNILEFEWERSFGQYVSHILKQGNVLQKNQITNQIKSNL